MAFNNRKPSQQSLFSKSGGGSRKNTSSPQDTNDSVPQANQRENHQPAILRTLQDMFMDVFDKDVIDSVAQSCDWELNKSVEVLIMLSSEGSEFVNSHKISNSKPETLEGNTSKQRGTSPKNKTAINSQDEPNKNTVIYKRDNKGIKSTSVHSDKDPGNFVGTSNKSPMMAAGQGLIKVSYKGFDDPDDSDDADVVIEEENEIEIPGNANLGGTFSLAPHSCTSMYQFLSPMVSSPTHVEYGATAKIPSYVQMASKKDNKSASSVSDRLTKGIGANKSNSTSLESSKLLQNKVKPLTQLERVKKLIFDGIKVMVIMRGCPGSGKSHLAKNIIKSTLGKDCIKYVFSTDNYFVRIGGGQYVFLPDHLPEAHEWNRQCVQTEARRGTNPIIVDNTNLEIWEMKPYAEIAVRNGYCLELLEPSTPWRYNAAELGRKNVHNVSRKKIQDMLDRFERNITGGKLLAILKLKYSPSNKPPQPSAKPPPPQKANKDANKPVKKNRKKKVNSETSVSGVTLPKVETAPEKSTNVERSTGLADVLALFFSKNQNLIRNTETHDVLPDIRNERETKLIQESLKLSIPAENSGKQDFRKSSEISKDKYYGLLGDADKDANLHDSSELSDEGEYSSNESIGSIGNQLVVDGGDEWEIQTDDEEIEHNKSVNLEYAVVMKDGTLIPQKSHVMNDSSSHKKELKEPHLGNKGRCWEYLLLTDGDDLLLQKDTNECDSKPSTVAESTSERNEITVGNDNELLEGSESTVSHRENDIAKTMNESNLLDMDFSNESELASAIACESKTALVMKHEEDDPNESVCGEHSKSVENEKKLITSPTPDLIDSAVEKLVSSDEMERWLCIVDPLYGGSQIIRAEATTNATLLSSFGELDTKMKHTHNNDGLKECETSIAVDLEGRVENTKLLLEDTKFTEGESARMTQSDAYLSQERILEQIDLLLEETVLDTPDLPEGRDTVHEDNLEKSHIESSKESVCSVKADKLQEIPSAEECSKNISMTVTDVDSTCEDRLQNVISGDDDFENASENANISLNQESSREGSIENTSRLMVHDIKIQDVTSTEEDYESALDSEISDEDEEEKNKLVKSISQASAFPNLKACPKIDFMTLLKEWKSDNAEVTDTEHTTDNCDMSVQERADEGKTSDIVCCDDNAISSTSIEIDDLIDKGKDSKYSEERTGEQVPGNVYVPPTSVKEGESEVVQEVGSTNSELTFQEKPYSEHTDFLQEREQGNELERKEVDVAVDTTNSELTFQKKPSSEHTDIVQEQRSEWIEKEEDGALQEVGSADSELTIQKTPTSEHTDIIQEQRSEWVEKEVDRTLQEVGSADSEVTIQETPTSEHIYIVQEQRSEWVKEEDGALQDVGSADSELTIQKTPISEHTDTVQAQSERNDWERKEVDATLTEVGSTDSELTIQMTPISEHTDIVQEQRSEWVEKEADGALEEVGSTESNLTIQETPTSEHIYIVQEQRSEWVEKEEEEEAFLEVGSTDSSLTIQKTPTSEHTDIVQEQRSEWVEKEADGALQEVDSSDSNLTIQKTPTSEHTDIVQDQEKRSEWVEKEADGALEEVGSTNSEVTIQKAASSEHTDIVQEQRSEWVKKEVYGAVQEVGSTNTNLTIQKTPSSEHTDIPQEREQGNEWEKIVLDGAVQEIVSTDCELTIQKPSSEYSDILQKWEQGNEWEEKELLESELSEEDNSLVPKPAREQRNKIGSKLYSERCKMENEPNKEINFVPPELLSWSVVAEPFVTWEEGVAKEETVCKKRSSSPQPQRSMFADTAVDIIHDQISLMNKDEMNEGNVDPGYQDMACSLALENAVPKRSTSSTNTHHSDFMLLLNINSGNEIELQSDMTVLSAYNRDIIESMKSPPKFDTVKMPQMRTLDKSSMTNVDDEFQVLPQVPEIASRQCGELSLMFPQISNDDLREIFERCNMDINWTVDLLLESEREGLQLSSLSVGANTNELGDVVMANLVGPEITESVIPAFADVSPSAPPESAIMTDALPKTPSHLKKNGKKDRSTQPSELSIQLKRQLEENFVINQNHYSEHVLRIRKLHHGEIVRMWDESDSLEPAAGNTDVDQASGIDMSGIPQPNVENLDNYLHQFETSTELADVGQEQDKEGYDSCMEEEEESATVPLTLGRDFIHNLQDLFGTSGLPFQDLSTVVNVPLSLARQLHYYVMEAQQSCYETMMQEDEELARRMQNQEMSSSQSSEVPDLREIMDMEMALALYKTDQNQWRTETKDDMATKLSKQMLCNTFPSVAKDVLMNVFQAHNNSFEETLEVLMASTGQQDDEGVLTVMSPEARTAYEKALLEKAAQETIKNTEHPLPPLNEENVEVSQEQAFGDAEFYRSEASRHYELRKECLNKAQVSYRRGLTAAASYYSQMAALHKKRIEDSNARAASSLLMAHSVGYLSTTLDLHFLYVAEAMQVLNMFIDHHISYLLETGQKNRRVFVITGRGLRSSGGRSRIRPAVESQLGSRGLKYKEVNPGLLEVTITRNAALSSSQVH